MTKKDKSELLSLHMAAIIQASVDMGQPVPEVGAYRSLINHGYDDAEVDAVITGLFELGMMERVSHTMMLPTEKGKLCATAFLGEPITKKLELVK